MKKIVLTGYMGSGKTTVGKKIAQQLNISFIDLDYYIESNENLSINDIFKQKGEVYFRKQEHILFNELLNKKELLVISLGGGTVCYANNHLLLQKNNVESVYLKANISTLVNRLQNNTKRPLLSNIENLNNYIAQHLFERNYYYNFAKYTFNIDNKKINEVAREILNKIDLT